MSEVANTSQASRAAGRPTILERARQAAQQAAVVHELCPHCGGVVVPAVLLVPEAAAYLRCSEAQIRIMLNKGMIPGSKIDWKWRILRVDLDALLERNKRPLRP